MRTSLTLATLALAGAIACGGDVPTQPRQSSNDFTSVLPPAGGVAQFSFLPVAIAAGQSVTALGNLNPPGHTLPSDHIYFYDGDLSGNRPTGSDVRDVVMPATGAAMFILQQPSADYKVMFRATGSFYFYLDHILLDHPITMGQVLQAGTKIGVTTKGAAIDLGAFDMSVQHAGFIDTTRYAQQSTHYVAPRDYFTPILRDSVDAHLYRAASATSRGGQIDFGVAGRLVGDWFLQGMAKDSSAGPYGWTRQMAFVYDYYDPSKVRISVGGTVSTPGVWGIDSTVARPAAVTPSTGLIAYKLYSPFDPNFPPTGTMLVQMLDASTIKVEVFMGSNVTVTQFDTGAVVFIR